MVGGFKGFAKLQGPVDLYQKLLHDRSRMRMNSLDVYAAFDFFVTAEHMRDWVHPGHRGAKAREAMRRDDVVLRLISHLANGSKHFLAEDKTQLSVVDVSKSGYAENYVEDGYWEQALEIQLTLPEQGAIGASTISAAELADRALQFWESYLKLDSLRGDRLSSNE